MQVAQRMAIVGALVADRAPSHILRHVTPKLQLHSYPVVSASMQEAR
jgi:hypothetical protein